MTVYFSNATSGDNANDGLDDLGLALATASYDDTGHGDGEHRLQDGSAPFTPGMAGMYVALTGGAGITPGLYLIATFISTSVVLLATSAGSDSTSDVTSSDGPRLTIGSALADADNAVGNEVRLVASATKFLPTAELTVSTPTSVGDRTPIRGCASGGAVDGTVTTISMASMPTTGSGDLFGIGDNNVNLALAFLRVEGNAGGAAVVDTSFRNCAIDILGCEIDGLLYSAIRIAGGTSTIRIEKTKIQNGAGLGLDLQNTTTGTASTITIADSRIEGNATGGIAWIGSNRASTLVVERSSIAHNGTTTAHHGISLPGTSQAGNRCVLEGCIIDQNGGSGVSVGSGGVGQLVTRNCSITENGAYAVALSGASDVTWLRDIHCCYDGNASGVSNGGARFVDGRVLADPLYVDSSWPDPDYHTVKASPLRGAATEAP